MTKRLLLSLAMLLSSVIVALVPTAPASAASWITWTSYGRDACYARLNATVTDLRRAGYVVEWKSCQWVRGTTATGQYTGSVSYYRPKFY